MAGEWIAPKARGIFRDFFPGDWEDKGGDVLEGRCPAQDAHSHGSARTDARVYLGYGPQGQPPGVYCLHNSCKGRLEGMNEDFRTALFARDGERPGRPQEEGVVRMAPRAREAWVPEFSFEKLAGAVRGAPEVGEEFFMERSPVDVRGVTPGGFLEAVFSAGDRVLVFTDFKSQGDYLWEVGKGGYRLGAEAGVRAVRSKLPVECGRDGAWFLNNPVDGKWHANPRRDGRTSRRSQEAVKAWRHIVLECDEEKTMLKQAAMLREARRCGDAEGYFQKMKADPKWVARMMPQAGRWEALAGEMEARAPQVPGLWRKLLAISGLPIVAIYSSGGVSLHALVRDESASWPEFSEKLRDYKRRAPLVGADPAAITPVRLTRLPGCTRGGRMQQLFFLNPKADTTPIATMARARTLGGGSMK